MKIKARGHSLSIWHVRAGRIRHHLKHNLWRPECTILFAGYQAEGSLGCVLLGGAKNIRLFGEEICVKARIARMRGISGHADRKDLRWGSHVHLSQHMYLLFMERILSQIHLHLF